jgi:hypothetical protein
MKQLLQKLANTPLSIYFIYLLIYIPWGFAMNEFGKWAEIAQFNNWWQVLTCYGLYMIPISVLLRKHSFITQYVFGFLAMAVMEFFASIFETSFAFEDNLIDQFFGIRNYTLALAFFFALYFPLGNYLVTKVHSLLFK